MNALDLNPEHLKELVRREIPYGKYKGRILADLPGDYLRWYAREGYPSGELRRQQALKNEIDHNGLAPLLDPLRAPR